MTWVGWCGLGGVCGGGRTGSGDVFVGRKVPTGIGGGGGVVGIVVGVVGGGVGVVAVGIVGGGGVVGIVVGGVVGGWCC